MKIAFIQHALLVFLALPSFAFAESEMTSATDLIIQSDKIFDPDQLSFDSIQLYEKNFTFYWHDAKKNNSPDTKKIKDIERFLNTTSPSEYTTLAAADRQALGQIIYRLGTYYLYAKNDLSSGMKKISLASVLLNNKKDNAWNANQLAYIYEKRYATTDEDIDKEKALHYIDYVINTLYPDATNHETAFAYYINGLVQYDIGNYEASLASLQKALHIYEILPDGRSGPYLTAKNAYTNVMAFNKYLLRNPPNMIKYANYSMNK